MTESDGLGRLEMREAGHDRGRVRLGLFHQCTLQLDQSGGGARASITHPQPEIRCDLVVARARRVQPRAGRTRNLRQPLLDVEMDVFQLALEGEPAGRDIGCDLVEPGNDRVAIGPGDNPLRRQHPGMRLRARDIVIGEAFVEIDGDVYLLHDPGGTALEAPAPHFVRRHRLNRCLICALCTLLE